jgi:prophage antirepressor-like protein
MPTRVPDDPLPGQGRVILFQEQAIRRSWNENEWWFSVVDVCAVLTGSVDPGAYWRKLKQRLVAESGQPVTFCHGLKLTAADGRQRVTDCANTEGLFRVIQSVPSLKAEPFKRWLAQVGYERVREIENPGHAKTRPDNSAARRRQAHRPLPGSGLGLAIVERLAAGHGGRFDLARAPGGRVTRAVLGLPRPTGA